VNFELNEDQLLLKNLTEQFVADRYDDLTRRDAYQQSQSGFSGENWALLAELGLLALPFAEDDGGLGGGMIEIITVMEALGRALVTEPLLGDLLLAGALIAETGTEAQKARWLPRIMSGEARVALAHFEHEARYDIGHVGARSQRDGGSGFKLEGAKTLVLSGADADAYLVSARNGDDIHFHIVPADSAGLHRRDYRLVDGSVASELRLLSVPAGERLAGGMAEFARVVDRARIAMSAEMLGIMSMLFDTTLDYVRTRKQFGVPIGSFQAIQHRLADLYAALELSRSQLYRAALAQDSDEGRARAIAGAKSYVSANAVRLGEECIQLHGGIGTSNELIVGHGHKRLLLLATLFGDSDSELERFNALGG
jgi:alkylation response protein AidB-like acyl-CoA dehydrogenase